MFNHLKLSLVLIVSATFLISGCSIKDETSQETKIQLTENSSNKPKTKTQRFIDKCSKCILGDLSELDDIIATYQSSFTPSTNYPKGAFLYQRIAPTQAFERCAQKAMTLGNSSAFNAMIIRQGKIARTARYFYATNKLTEGAFWLQRIINVKGEMDGLEVAGRIFIQDIRTIGIGVRLLEQSARLGNRNARQMLMGLMNPGSSYYQQITKNSSKDEEIDQSNEAIEKYDAQIYEPNPKASNDKKALAKNKAQPKDFELLDDESENVTVFTQPLTDSEVKSRAKIQEARAGQISLYDSQEPKSNDIKDPLKDLAEPKNLGIGYMETAIKANNQAPSEPQTQAQTPVLHSTEDTIKALSDSDPELNMPLELYEQDHKSHQQKLKAKKEAQEQQSEQAGLDLNGMSSPSQALPSNFDKQKREEQIKRLEQKALEASEAAKRRINDAQSSSSSKITE